MTFTLRPMGRNDIPWVFPLLSTSFPCMVLTEGSLRWRADHPRPEVVNREILAVDEDDVPIGFVRAQTSRDTAEDEPSKGYIGLMSLQEAVADTPGLRAALLEEAERVLAEDGAVRVRAEACGEEVQTGGAELTALLHERGYTETVESHRIMSLDLARLPEPPHAPDGVELLPFSSFVNDPRPLYEVDRQATMDEPGEREGKEFMSYPEWVRNVWPHPLMDREVSLAVLVDGEVVGFSAYSSDGYTRVESAMTGTLAAHRGRGLARLAKTAALHRARERGLRYAYTGNHSGNVPMLAINSWLGYQIAGVEELLARPDGQG